MLVRCYSDRVAERLSEDLSLVPWDVSGKASGRLSRHRSTFVAVLVRVIQFRQAHRKQDATGFRRALPSRQFCSASRFSSFSSDTTFAFYHEAIRESFYLGLAGSVSGGVGSGRSAADQRNHVPPDFRKQPGRVHRTI